MNLIDFHVTKIIEEKKDKVYKLYNMSEEQLIEESKKEDNWWYNYLIGNGVEQVFEYWDEGGKRINSEIFNLDQGNVPYYVGYIGQH
jgi:hypothetical protein